VNVVTDPIRGWQEFIATVGDDEDLFGQFQAILYGAQGDDQLRSTSFIANQALVGGSGDDHYTIQSDTEVWIVDGFGSPFDRLSALWSIDPFSGNVFAIEGRHLVVEDFNTGTTAIFVNGLREVNFVEIWQVFGRVVTFFEFLYATAGPAAFVVDEAGNLIPDEGILNISWEDFVGNIQGPVYRDFADYMLANAQQVEATLEDSDASEQADNLFGGEGDDIIRALAGDDVVQAAGGDDVVYGNQGQDQIYGNQGDDDLFGGQGDDFLFGGKNSDLIYGNFQADVAYGNLGNDTIYGGRDDDILFGGQGDDVLFGNLGNDHLFGNRGDDELFGNFGNDFFYFVGDFGDDVVKDFELGIDAALVNGDIMSTSTAGGHTIFEFANGSSIEFENVIMDLDDLVFV
jgi:Ca2+-binding RTX toxin-like protein